MYFITYCYELRFILVESDLLSVCSGEEALAHGRKVASWSEFQVATRRDSRHGVART